MTNVVILGVGAAGEVTARLLAQEGGIDVLRLVDLRGARLAEVASKIDRDVETLRADLARPADVRRACRDADILVNAALPDFNFRTMQEALRIPAHYVDLASEGSPKPNEPSRVHEQIALDPEFRRVNRTAILGMGLAPGITNLLTRRAADRMDRVDAIRIRVYGSGYAEVDGHAFAPLFSPATFLDEVLWPAPVWKGDRIVKLPPFSGEEEFPFPDPLGTGFCYNVNNEECETMPLYLSKPIGFIDFKYAIAPHRKVLLENLYTMGLTRSDPLAVNGKQVSPLQVLLALLPDPATLGGRVQGHTCVVVETEGRASGKKVAIRSWTILDHEVAYRMMGVHATAFLTGAPPAAAVGALIAGAIEGSGCTTAGGLDPVPVLQRVMRLGVPMFDGDLTSRRGRALAA